MKLPNRTICVIAICGLVAVTAAGWYFLFSSAGHNLPDPTTLRPEQAPGIFGSEDFRSLPRQQRRQYAEQAMTAFVINTAAEYCQLPPEQRQGYIDNIIFMMELAGADFDSDEHAQRRSRPGPSPREVHQFAERVDSQARAQIIQFTADFQKRLQQRRSR